MATINLELKPASGMAEIQVDDDVIINADIDDGWFAIYDKDNLHYDELGSVIFSTSDILDLIKALFILYFEISGVPILQLAVRVKGLRDKITVDIEGEKT